MATPHEARVLNILQRTDKPRFMTAKRLAVRRLLRKWPAAQRVLVSHEKCPSCKRKGALIFFTLPKYKPRGSGAYCGLCGFSNACGEYAHKHKNWLSDNNAYQE